MAAGPAMAAKADLPAGATLSFCHGYGCEIRTLVRLTDKDMATLQAIVAKGKANPAEELKALGKAEQWYEIRAAAFAGTGKAPGRVDSPPTSITSAPSASMRSACSMA